MQEQGLGRSKGGFSRKLHAACDDVVEGRETDALIADKGYDADYMVQFAKDAEAEAVIPPRSRRKIARTYDQELYKERNVIV